MTYLGIPYGKPVQGRIEVDELNLLYVALMRAKRLLVINDALFFLLSSSFINHSLEYLLPVQPAYPSPCVKRRGGVEVTGPVSMYLERMRVGDMTRHNLGGWDRK
jgi:hypothetical protein